MLLLHYYAHAIFQMTKLACLLVCVVLAIIPVTYADSDSKTIKTDIAPEYFESSVTPCSLFSLSCKAVCGRRQLSSSSCDVAKGSNHASLDCTCGLVRWKSYAAAQIFQPITIQVSKLEDGKFCDMFKAECLKINTGVIVANGCRLSESGVPNKVDTTCISVTDEKFDRHEDKINDRLNKQTPPTKTTPPKPQITTVESKYVDEACGVFSSLCALKRGPKCLSGARINSCSSSLGNNQLEVQCSCGDLDFTSELVKAIKPTLLSIDSTCISKDICGLFKSGCSKECDVTPLMNVCYVPYIITNFRVGCICGDGTLKTPKVLNSVKSSCKLTTFQS